MSLKAILFDLDGVITDTARFHYLAWKNLANELGIEIDLEFNEKLKGVSRMESLELILEEGGLENSFSKEEKEKLATKKNTEYVSLIDQLTPKDILPGISQLLSDAKDKGILMAVASASKNAPKILDNLQLASYFDVVVDPDSVKKGKPAPDIFVKAMEMLNVSKDECVGVEDAVSGVQAINSAGILSIAIGDSEELDIADVRFDSTSELNLEKIIDIFNEYGNKN